MTDSDELLLWERQVGEPGNWFSRFNRYRALGEGRKIMAAFRQERLELGDTTYYNRAPVRWYQVARKWRWEERVHAWDQHQADQARQQEEDDIKRARTLRRALLSSFWERLIEAVAHLPAADVRWAEITPAVNMIVSELREEFGDKSPLRIEGSWRDAQSELGHPDLDALGQIVALLDLRRTGRTDADSGTGDSGGLTVGVGGSGSDTRG